MSYAQIALLGFFLVAGLFIYLTILDAGRWRKKIESTLPKGFAACVSKDEKTAFAQRLQIVHPRHQGKRLLLHLYRQHVPDRSYDLYVCDYRFASASGKMSGAHRILVCLVSKALDLPRLSIESVPVASGLASKLFQSLAEAVPMPGLEKIETGDTALDQRFRVFAESVQVRNVSFVVKQIRTLLRDEGGVFLDAAGDSLILSSIEMGADLVRHEVDSQKLLRLIHVGVDLYERLRPLSSQEAEVH